MYGADSQRRTWPLWTYCWGKHTAVGRGVQPTSCNLLAGCSKCSGKLGYTSTRHKELLTERRASYPASYTEAKQIHHVWPLYHRFFQTSGWIKFSTWTVVFRTASRGSVWLQIALRCNSLVEQHGFFCLRGSWWDPHWLYYKAKSNTILCAIKCEMNPR